MRPFLSTFLLVFFAWSAGFAQVNLSSGLVAHYPFSGNANDASGNNNNPAVLSGLVPAAGVAGVPNTAYYFNGSSSYIEVPGSTSLNAGGPMSVTVYFKPEGFYYGACAGNALVDRGNSDFISQHYSIRFDYELYQPNHCGFPMDTLHQLVYGIRYASAAPTYVYSPYIQKGQWYCVAMVQDATSLKFYMNGTLVGNTPLAPGSTGGSDPLMIGRKNSAAFPYWFKGVIDDVRVYNRALNPAEVSALCGEIGAPPSSASCFSIINLPDTVQTCKNGSVQLNPALSSVGLLTPLDTTWTPAAGLSNPNIINPVATIGATGVSYKLTVLGLSPVSLVSNGNFSAGNAGFTTAYSYTAGSITTQGQYAVTSNPNVVHPLYSSFPDHTGNPGGLMLVADAHPVSNTNVWCQTISVQPNTLYNFGAWAASAYPQNPANLQFTVNGVPISGATALPGIPGQWTNMQNTWNSGSNTSITLCIRETTGVVQGCDFAIDDITLRNYCVVVDSVFIKPTNLQTAIGFIPAPGCNSDTARFTAIGTGDTPTAYEWSFGDGSPDDTAKNPTHIYAQQGGYAVRLIATLNGCRDTAFTTVSFVHPVNASFSLDADSVCLGASIQFTSTGTAAAGPATLYWSFGDGDTSAQANPVHTYSQGGVYNIIYIIRDAIRCRDTAASTVWVFEPHNPAISLSDSLFCEGEGFIAVADTSFRPETRAWDLGDGTTYSGIGALSHSYDTSGTFTIRLKETYTLCPADSAGRIVVVSPQPLVNLGPDTFLCVNGAPIPVEDGAAASQSGLHYQWSTGDTGKARILARNYGEYWLEATSDAGCRGADTVQVYKDCYLDVPNAFTPDGDGLNDYFFPRQLLGRSLTGFNMQVFNRWGQLIFETKSVNGRGWDGKFNNVMQPQGAYVYLINVQLDGNVKESYTGNVTLLR